MGWEWKIGRHGMGLEARRRVRHGMGLDESCVYSVCVCDCATGRLCDGAGDVLIIGLVECLV